MPITDMLLHCTAVSKIRLTVCLGLQAPNVVCCRIGWCCLCCYHPSSPGYIHCFPQLLFNGKFFITSDHLRTKRHISGSGVEVSLHFQVSHITLFAESFPFAFAVWFVQLHPVPCLRSLLLQSLGLSWALCMSLLSQSKGIWERSLKA